MLLVRPVCLEHIQFHLLQPSRIDPRIGSEDEGFGWVAGSSPAMTTERPAVSPSRAPPAHRAPSPAAA